MKNHITPQQLDIISRQARNELARRYYKDYVEQSHHGSYTHFKHTLLICDYLQRIAEGEQMHLMIEMPPRHSKLCADSTPVYTPDGWVTHGDLKVGDYVYHPSGKAIEVKHVKPKCNADYVVTFSNGEKIRTHECHEWTVYNRNKQKYETLETQDMKEDCFDGAIYKYMLPEVAFFDDERRIGVVSVDYQPNGEVGNCITVGSEDGLYLVGKTLLPTHNSMTVTETFPSYFLGRNPDKRVIASAYSERLARKFGRLNRNKFGEFAGNVFNVSLAQDNTSNTDWGIKGHNGGMISTGIGGAITGQGADLLLIDDPIKNAKEALSKTIRDNIWNEWESTLSTRLHDGASVIVIMTRWHEDDLIGRLLEQSPYNWVRLRLPAIAEDEDDILNREIGEALCAGLGYDEEWAALKKQEVGSRTWASLYQQRPAPAEGSIFDRNWFKFQDAAPARYDDMVMSWDFTFKDAESSDYVVGQVWQKVGGEFYCIDQVRDRMDFTQSIHAVVNLKRKYPRCRTVLIEDKANGTAIINTLKKKVSGIVPISPRDSKVARAYAVTPYFEAGNVYFLNGVPELNDTVEEITGFPNYKHDKKLSWVNSVNCWDTLTAV